MNFDLTEEQEMLQETVRQFITNECPLQRVHELFDAEDAHDPALWKGLCEMGLGGIQIPEEFGGAGFELIDLALVAEVLGEGAVPGPFLGHALASLAVLLGGSDEQKEQWLPKLASGEAVGTVALAEGEQVWQPEQWTVAWTPQGDSGRGSLSGTKSFVPFAGIADLIIVGTAGGGLALVSSGSDGLEIKEVAGVDRTRRLAEVQLADVSAEQLPHGAAAAGKVRDAGLVLLAADAIGGAWRCVENSVSYAGSREQFGTTIGHFQALKHQLANMAVDVEPARALYWYGAHAFDHIEADRERSCAIAKAHVTDRYMQVVRDTVEAHGGIGFTWEGDVQLYFKRAMFNRAFLGAPEQHRARSADLGGW
ncbi:MAG: acyl-CoA/acyl-ACP dehydrogenase [bacterium]|nr:acyl-CoA/acyl-ACP dehydrogenase [bacterium]